MGNTNTKSSIDVVNSMAIRSIQETIQNCTTTATNNQLIDLGYVVGDVTIDGLTQKQGISVKMDCVLESNTTNKMAANIASVIKQYADAESEGLLVPPGGTEVEVISNIENDLEIAMRQTDAQESVSEATNNQTIQAAYVGGNFVLKNVTMDQSIQMVATSIVKSTKVQETLAGILADLDQKSTATSKGTDAIIGDTISSIVDSITSSVGLLIALPIIIIFIFIGVIMFMNSGGGKKGKSRIYNTRSQFRGMRQQMGQRYGRSRR